MARKAPTVLKEDQKEFVKSFNSLCDRHQAWQVWSDFVEMSAIAISNACDQSGRDHDKREQRYQQIEKCYSEKEITVYRSMFAQTVDALDRNQDQDFLGEMFMALELGSHWHGQFFTPYNVCRMMAEMTIPEYEYAVERHGFGTVNDPACGAGATLIATRNVMQRKGYGYQQLLFVAQDIDRTAALMCYIQLSLLGCAGYVCIADTLLHPLTSRAGDTLLPLPDENHDLWFTPMFYDKTWQTRILLRMITGDHKGVPISKLSMSELAAEGPESIPAPKEETEKLLMNADGQIMMF